MKTSRLFYRIFVVTAPALLSQALPAAASLSASLPPDVAAFQIVEHGPHYRVWQSYTTNAGAARQLSITTNSYTELATGLYYQDRGEWLEAKELIEPSSDGAIARHGQHTAAFAYNLASADAITLTTPDGKELRSHIAGLGYHDAGGKTVLIAEVKDCAGKIVNGNQVLYADAFTGFRADVRYTYTRAGLEQDIILREQPPQPETFGLDSKTTSLEAI
ncbi:MAG TPA: hypothetical protein VHB20_16175, partial [Verrucomicrobiae bacterium]|nr:hypothetical protein [Verrucomicrobiae bacterium]